MSSSLNRFLKLSRKSCLISFKSVLHKPFSSFIALMLFLLLRMMVERWKNLEFLSPSLSQSSLDFWRQRASLLINHFDNSDCNEISIASFSWDEGLSWTCLIFWSREFILFWHWPKTSLFHFRSASLVVACFL